MPSAPLAKLGYALQLRRGEHHERDDVHYLRGTQVTVSGDAFYAPPTARSAGPERQRCWHVEPAAYSLMLPTPRAGVLTTLSSL